jgi:hypothetical protein
MAKVIACSACGGLFTSKRSTARFCKSRCRVSAHRGHRIEGPARAIRRAVGSFLSVTGGDHHTPAAQIDACNAKASLPKRKRPGRYRA